MNDLEAITTSAPPAFQIVPHSSDAARRELNLALYRKTYLIRSAETAIREHYAEDEMKTPMHMSMGGEAISAGVCHALSPQDQILGTYRSHGIYLARTMETDRFFAEMYGRATGTSGGKAGSMHLMAPEHGLVCTSAIVASHIPVALGAAFVNRCTQNGRMVAVFFGDGAVDEGAFWESLNFACLKRLPLLFVCEDNGYAVHSPGRQRHGYRSIAKIAEQFDCDACASESTDVEKIYGLARGAVQRMREQRRPAFLHLRYYRYLEHVGVFEDFQAGYRSRAEYERWSAVDPIRLQREKLLRLGLHAEVEELESAIDRQVRRSVAKARLAPLPDPQELCRGVAA